MHPAWILAAATDIETLVSTFVGEDDTPSVGRLAAVIAEHAPAPVTPDPPVAVSRPRADILALELCNALDQLLAHPHAQKLGSVTEARLLLARAKRELA